MSEQPRPLLSLAARLLIWTAFVALGLVAVARTGLTQGAVGGVFATSQSIVRDDTLAIDGNTAMISPLDRAAPGLAYHANRYYAAQPPGAALIGAPAAWVGLPLADVLDRPDAAVLLIGVIGLLLLMLAAAAFAWAGERLGMPPILALLTAAIGVGAFLFPVGALTNAVAIIAIVSVLLALALADGADRRVEERWTPHGRLALAGLVLGLLPFFLAFGWIATGCVALTLVMQGGRRWWHRVGWLAIGLAGPLVALALFNAAWFEHPWDEAWQFALGDPWQRALSGRFLDTPLTVLESSSRALGALVGRHPLLAVGWIGLCIGMWFVPWRARITTVVLLLALGAPALLERQGPGLAAEEHPVAVFVPFAVAGYLVLIALVAREWPKLVPVGALGGVALVGAGVVVSSIGNGAARPPIVRVGTEPAIYAAPIALCAAIVVLLIMPGLHVPRVRQERAIPVISVALILMLLLTSCGAASAPVPPTTATQGPNLLPPLATRLAVNVVTPLWTLDANIRMTGDGSALTAVNTAGSATAPVVPVQAGDGYRVAAHVVLAPGMASGGTFTVQWLNRAQQPLGESGVPLGGGLVGGDVGALPGAAYARAIVVVPPGALIDEVRLIPRTGGRLDALPNYARAALSFSFDFETAMGGLIHTRGGTVDHDVADAEARALNMRAGALFLRGLFAAYDVRGTFYVNGYNFLTGNTERQQFVGNPTYARYGQKNGWASDYWATHPWYGDDPYGTEQSNPAWYFGSLTKQLAQDGNDIESHTFGHLFLHAGITAQELDDDLTAWDAMAKQQGFAPAHSFAFPWSASNSVTEEYYAVLAKHGITNVTRFYDYDPKKGPFNYFPVPAYPQLRVVPDAELTDRAGDEAAVERGLELALAQGGVFSIWAHPESIATPTAQAIWGRVVAYATDRRSLGLWIAPVTTIAAFADARDRVQISSVSVGATTMITVTNGGTSGVTDATLTLPRAPKQVGWTGGGGPHDINGAQVRVGLLAAGETTTIEVRYP